MMKKQIGRLVYVSGVLGSLFMGVQALTAQPATLVEEDDPTCYKCEPYSDGSFYCYPIICPS